MNNSGLFFLKGAPLSKGHISAITRACSEVDELFVVLCWDEKFQNTVTPFLQEKMSRKNRELWLVNSFKHNPKIKVISIDETPIPPYPEGETDFTVLVRNELFSKFGVTSFDAVFSSEPSYDSYFSKNFPEAKIVVIDSDRSLVDISATRIRSDLYSHWDYLAPEAQKTFVKKVCVIGVESSGKSTLVQNLAMHYGTTFVPEVGRHICEDEFGWSEQLMTPADYEYIAMKHKCTEQEALKTARKVLLSDTNNLITLFSALCSGMDSELLRAMVQHEKYDLVIFLDKDVPWVYDRLRMNNTPQKRNDTFEMLTSLCRNYGVKYELISGDYNNRYLKSIELIDNLLKP